MPEIRFSAEKADRWLTRIEKCLTTLSPEDVRTFRTLRAIHAAGRKLDSQQAKALWDLGRKL